MVRVRSARPSSASSRRWLLLSSALTAGALLAVFAWQPDAEAEWTKRADICNDVCPDGTFEVDYERVVTGRAAVITGYRCEQYCEPILPCPPPNVPTIVKVGDENQYSCAPLEGFSTIPSPNDIDFSFAEGWTP